MASDILKIVEIICPVISVFVAYFLLKESRKMYKMSTSPNLVFSFHSLSSYMIMGRLENIGNGTAYNIEVDVSPDFTVMKRKSLNKAFENVNYLAPKQSFDVLYCPININNRLIGFKSHSLKVSWSHKKKSNKRHYFDTHFEESYFDSFPSSHTFDDLVKEIKDLNRNLSSVKL